MHYLIIDGAQGEGGGQVLRSALTLAMLTQQNIEIINIRAGRKKPGLLRQHLTCVLASQQICGAVTDGVELGSTRIRFAPGNVKAGNYQFAIGTAGSTVLVCQTVLPALALATGESNVTFSGGTHNGLSPSLCFLQQAYLPILQHMGVVCQVTEHGYGFYPAGGGKWQLNIKPSLQLAHIELSQAGADFAVTQENCGIRALLSQLPDSIGQREVETAQKLLNWQQATSRVKQVSSPGPGNSLQLSIRADTHTNLFERVGEYGVSAERVAKRTAGRVRKFIQSQAAVEEYLADQLLLPIALAGSGRFTTTKPSLHTLTNIAVIKQLLGKAFMVEQLTPVLWQISLDRQ
ncbi:RNA 3'-terminal phosphate cyclase [Motilimonas cestriensis]|uniref:RNA 3'-terminal phosphate cyclase n=1 Tax=Motilimonas cestriensis TaxID=2742685 RepID=UPI003DA6C552